MIREFAMSLSNRHHFRESNQMSEIEGIAQDTFMSLWEYDDYVIEYFNKKKKLAGFDGVIYMPDDLILDIDGKNDEQAKKIKFIMENAIKLKVPNKVDYESGPNWGTIK